MSNRQFWNLLDLGIIANTTFAKLFYKAACDFNDNTKLDHLKFMDKAKFYQFVAVFTKTKELNENMKRLYDGDKNEFIDLDEDKKTGQSSSKQLENKKKTFAWAVKLKFINSLFDSVGNEEIDRLEFRNFMSSFIEMILSSKFECGPIQEQINNILSIDTSGGTSNLSQLVEKVLDLYVDEVFAHHSYNGEVLTFEEWTNWIYENIAGFEEVLDYSATIVSKTILN